MFGQADFPKNPSLLTELLENEEHEEQFGSIGFKTKSRTLCSVVSQKILKLQCNRTPPLEPKKNKSSLTELCCCGHYVEFQNNRTQPIEFGLFAKTFKTTK